MRVAILKRNVMRIVIDMRPLQIHRTRGLGTYARNLVENLLRIDYEYEYLLFFRTDIGQSTLDIQTNNSRKKDIFLKRPHRGARFQWLLDQILLPIEISLRKPNIFHSLLAQVPFRVNCPTVVTLPDFTNLILNEKGLCKKPLDVRMGDCIRVKSMRKADKIITLSENSKRDIVRLLPAAEKKVEVIYLASDSNYVPVREKEQLIEIRRKYSIKNDFILYVGGFGYNKNINRLIQAFYEFSLISNHKWQLVLVGKLPNEKIASSGDDTKHERVKDLKNLIHSLGLVNEVVFTGFVPDEDLPALYSAARLFIFPSLYEGFGLPPLEAMACGTPVVASNTSSLPEVIGKAGILVNPLSIKEMVEAMMRVLASNTLQMEMHQKGLERTKRFSWEKTAQETLKVYHQLIEKGKYIRD